MPDRAINPEIRLPAVIVAALAAFVVGGVWYSPVLFGDAYLSLRGIDPAAGAAAPPIAEVLGELVRVLVVAYVIAHFVARLAITDWLHAMSLGLWVWVGFQAMLLAGAVIHEDLSWKLYAIHAGDALAKTLVTSAILGIAQARRIRRAA